MDYEVESFMKADIFSYGLVVHYMVTGVKPWASEKTVATVYERFGIDNEVVLPEPPNNLGQGPLQDLYDSCLCIEPEKRPTAEEIINKKFQGKRNHFNIVTKISTR